ncbi:MAG: hypothetical protein ACI9WU_004702, partial [Myxococcota bacterium]
MAQHRSIVYDALFRTMDNAPLVAFRIAFGFLIWAECLSAVATGWVRDVFLVTPHTLPAIGFEWLQPPAGLGMIAGYLVMGALGAMVMFGAWFRWALSRRLLADRQWLTRAGDGWSATSTGQHMAERMGITGTVASYRPMLHRTRQLLVGDARAVFERDIAGHEKHLDRTLNVTASGFQHGKYFADLECALLRIFDDPDLDQQPGYIVDMGCGDGTLLRQLYEAIQSRSLRGRALSSHPLTLVGADLNAQALAATSRTLRGLPHLTVHADINAPAGLLDALAARGITDPDSLLHIRSFLDHDRPYVPPVDRAAAAARQTELLDGVYVAPDGSAIAPGTVLQSLIEYLAGWRA